MKLLTWCVLGVALAFAASLDAHVDHKRSAHIRFGKRSAMIRFGKRGDEDMGTDDVHGDVRPESDKRSPLVRFGKRNPLVRFGKRSPLVRFGKRSPLVRFGKRHDSDAEYAEKRSPLVRFGKRSPLVRFG